MNNTGLLIKSLRKEKNINAHVLAEKLGVHVSTVYRYENGDIEKIPYQVLVPIAEVLGCSPVDLIGIEAEEKEARLLAAFRCLSDEQQDAIIIMVEGMKHAGL